MEKWEGTSCVVLVLRFAFTKASTFESPENVMLSLGDGHRCGNHQDQVGCRFLGS